MISSFLGSVRHLKMDVGLRCVTGVSASGNNITAPDTAVNGILHLNTSSSRIMKLILMLLPLNKILLDNYITEQGKSSIWRTVSIVKKGFT